MGNRVYRLVGGRGGKRQIEEEKNILDKTEYGIYWRNMGERKYSKLLKCPAPSGKDCEIAWLMAKFQHIISGGPG